MNRYSPEKRARIEAHADGAQTEDQLLGKMERSERVSNPHLVPLDLEAAIAADHLYSEAQAARLTQLLRDRVFHPEEKLRR